MKKTYIKIYLLVIILSFTACTSKADNNGLSNENFVMKELYVDDARIFLEIKEKLINTDETIYFIKDTSTAWAGVVDGDTRQFYELDFDKKTITPTVSGNFDSVLFLSRNEIAMIGSEKMEIFDNSYKMQEQIKADFERIEGIYETQEGIRKIIFSNSANKLYIKGEEKDIAISEAFNQYLGVEKRGDYLIFKEIMGTDMTYKIFDLKNETFLLSKELSQAVSSDNTISLNWMQGERYFELNPDSKEIQDITQKFDYIKNKHSQYDINISTTEIMPMAGIGVTKQNKDEQIIYYDNFKKAVKTRPISTNIAQNHIIVLEKIEKDLGFKLSSF